MTGIESVVIAVISAIIYSLAIYVKKTQKDYPESFEVVKVISTAVTGGIVGIFIVLSGSSVTEATIEVQLGLYGGLAVAVESIVRAIYRRTGG